MKLHYYEIFYFLFFFIMVFECVLLAMSSCQTAFDEYAASFLIGVNRQLLSYFSYSILTPFSLCTLYLGDLICLLIH